MPLVGSDPKNENDFTVGSLGKAFNLHLLLGLCDNALLKISVALDKSVCLT